MVSISIATTQLRPRRMAALVGRAAALVPVAGLLAMGWARRWVTEDAYIDLRVVGHLLAGHGPVFNAGERVEAYTSPLWVALLAAWDGVVGSPEIGAVVLGLLGSAAGLWFAQAGASALAERLGAGGAAGPERPPSLLLPFGALVYAAVPAAWDFATSGLEWGLGIAWLGGAFWLVVRARPTSAWTAFTIGVGPLVRPDFALFSLGFGAALTVAVASAREPRARARDWVRLVLAAGALPVAYEVFRMGYFASLVPNPALAKEAGAAWWRQGRVYTWDFVGTYALWLPLLASALLAIALVRRAARHGDRVAAVLVLGPMLSALAHAAYITRVGGDFMHGRLLLPSLFAFLLPVASIELSGPFQRWRVAALMGVAAWAVACALWLRVPYPNQGGFNTPHGIADERGFYADQLRMKNPVRAREWARNPGLIAFGRRLSRLGGMVALSGAEGLEPVAPLARGAASAGTVIALYNIGIMGYLAGSDVHVIDQLGLADPIGARLELARRGRPGHEKSLPRTWVVARFGDVTTASARFPDAPDAAAALGCGDLARLLRAVEAPLTPARFLANIRAAWGLHRLRIPPEPVDARRRFCGPAAKS